MVARVLARRDQVQAGILDALECLFGNSGLWRVALIICCIDHEQATLRCTIEAHRIWIACALFPDRRGKSVVSAVVNEASAT